MIKMEEAKLWQRTTIVALVFVLFYALMQYFIAGKTEPVSLLVGAVAFWLVFFIIQRAMAKHAG